MKGILFALTLVLTSCIEGEEEVWVNPDGSGKARLKVTAPKLLFAKFGGLETLAADLKDALQTSQNARLLEMETSTQGSRATLEAEIAFRDARKMGGLLKSFRDPPDSPDKCEEEIVFGEVKVHLGVPDLSFSRVIDLRPLVPAQSNNAMALKMLGEAQMSYRVHLPTPAKTHNADFISADGKTLAWEIPLAEFLQGSQRMEFTAPLPYLFPLSILAAVLLCLAVGAIFFVRKARTRKSSPS